MKEGTEKFDDSEKGGYSYAEKLALVAQEAMDPKEIGMASSADAKRELLNVAKKPEIEKLSDFATFEASVVPLRLRAHWTRQDLKVIPTNTTEWENEWMENHKNEYAIQAMLHSGTLAARIGQLFSDPILGFCELMRKAADILEDKYNELKAKDPNPIITREEIAAQQTENKG